MNVNPLNYKAIVTISILIGTIEQGSTRIQSSNDYIIFLFLAGNLKKRRRKGIKIMLYGKADDRV